MWKQSMMAEKGYFVLKLTTLTGEDLQTSQPG